jgi:hypothetical protein
MQKTSKAKLSLVACTLLFLSLLAAGSASWASAASTFGFGSNQIGAQSNSTFGGLFLSNFTAPTNLGNITQIQVYLATGGTSAQAVIYSDINGVPVALLDQSGSVNVSGTAGEWVSFDVNYTGIPAFTYWVGVLFDGAATYYYGPATNGTAIYSVTGATNATLYPSGTTITDNSLSVYAVYTPTSSSGQDNIWLETALLWVAVAGAIAALTLALAAVLTRKRNKAAKVNAA